MDLLGSDWSESDTTLSAVARALSRLRVESDARDSQPALRTSMMTHIAWVPPSWLELALSTLDGLTDRHPSRTSCSSPIRMPPRAASTPSWRYVASISPGSRAMSPPRSSCCGSAAIA